MSILNKYFNRFVIIGVFFTTILIFYGSSVQNELSLDDNFIFENIPPAGSDFSTVFDVFTKRFDVSDYRPIPMFTFALEQYIWGQINPEISHIINLILYFLLCCIIFSTLRKLPIQHAETIAIITTLLFLIHPVHAGIVNNLKSRDGLLSMLFIMLAYNQFIIFNRDKKIKAIILGALYFIAGMYSKLDAVNLILIIPITSVIIYKKKTIPVLFSFYVSYMIYVVFRLHLINYLIPYEEAAIENAVQFTENPLIKSELTSGKISQIITTYFYYLKFMIIPNGYYFYFGYDQVPLLSLYHPTTLLYLFAIIIPLIIAAYSYKKDKTITYGILIFYACLIYCSNYITPVQGIIADRYVFIASLGFLLAATAILLKISERLVDAAKAKSININGKWIYFTITLLIAFIYYPYVQERNAAWKTITTLLEADMPHLKQSFEANRIASTTYVNMAMNSTDRQKQIEFFQKGLQYAQQANLIYDKNIFTKETEAIAYYGLGNIEQAETDFKKIIYQFDTSVVSWDILADITFSRKKYDSTIYCYENILRIDPLNNDVYYKYPNILYQVGEKDSAFHFLNNAIKKFPDSYIPEESISYLYFFEKDTINSLNHMINAFEKGLNSDFNRNTVNNLLSVKPDKQLLSRWEKLNNK